MGLSPAEVGGTVYASQEVMRYKEREMRHHWYRTVVFIVLFLFASTQGVFAETIEEPVPIEEVVDIPQEEQPVEVEEAGPIEVEESLTVEQPAIPEGNTTLGGVNGYVVIPSALPVDSNRGASITTGYQALLNLPTTFAHIPYIQFGFAKNFEFSLAIDIESEADILLNGKWRFLQKGSTHVAFGFIGQALHVGKTTAFAAQTYIASTFSSNFIDWPSKTTILLGYTFKDGLDTNIDFGMGFQAPLLEKVFKGKVDFLIDFGNVSYSVDPSAGNAVDRGMLNMGVRLLPLEFMRSTFITADLRLIDILDHQGRGLSAGVSITFKP